MKIIFFSIFLVLNAQNFAQIIFEKGRFQVDTKKSICKYDDIEHDFLKCMTEVEKKQKTEIINLLTKIKQKIKEADYFYKESDRVEYLNAVQQFEIAYNEETEALVELAGFQFYGGTGARFNIISAIVFLNQQKIDLLKRLLWIE